MLGSFQWMEIVLLHQCHANKVVGTVWERPFCIPAWQSHGWMTWLDEFGVEELDRALTEPWPQPDRTPLGHGMGNGDWEPGLLVQHQCLALQTLHWIMGQKSHRNTSKSCGKPSQRNISCYNCKGGTNSILLSIFKMQCYYSPCWLNGLVSENLCLCIHCNIEMYL